MRKLFLLSSLVLFISCNFYKEGTFISDVEKLKSIESLEILFSDNSMIAVSGPYQGRILLSSANGWDGKSNGWVNWDMIEKGGHDSTMAYLGGESRLWFAPEFGNYSIFFDPGTEQLVSNIRAPHDLNTKKFEEVARTESSITYQGYLSIKNANRFTFNLHAKRTVAILSQQEIESNLNITLDHVPHVAYSASSTITNKNEASWTKENGLLSIWELGCITPAKDNVVIIPLTSQVDSLPEYFIPIDDSRIRIENATVFFKADANMVSKIGTPPSLTKNIMGSYSKENNQLKIATFTFNNGEIYVNSMAENKTPYEGDVINIFNGNVDKSKGENWPFFEFESSSEAKELQPGETLSHTQTTYHFDGDFETLNQISKKVLGVDLNTIPKF